MCQTYMWSPSNQGRLSQPSHQPQGQEASGPSLSNCYHSYQSRECMVLSHLVSSSRRRCQALEWTALSPLVSSSHSRRLLLEKLGLPPLAPSICMGYMCSKFRAEAWTVWARHPSSPRLVSSNHCLIEKQMERLADGGLRCLKYFVWFCCLVLQILLFNAACVTETCKMTKYHFLRNMIQQLLLEADGSKQE